ncbi:hypothetical protein PIB30_078009 [Stylosanthes scabra]|uniref:Putative plant transposon protein domain-containing protein n=1 Tax=Stylosanthes scabra TaxID=79078 RepID=A0ABU6YNB6_9FABA|nr:hypothetical protein [Stylosanthes scabra]
MASSSRKRKGKTAQNYESAKSKSLFHEDHYNRYTRFREVLPEARIQVDHADFAPMSEQITLKKWQWLTKPIQAVGYSLIREFYANAWIRGKDVIFSPEAIHKVLNLRSKPIPNVVSYYDRKEQNDLRLDDVLRYLCIEGAQWVFHDDGRHHFLRRTDLKPMARGWYEFVIRSIMPTGNHSEVTVEQAGSEKSSLFRESLNVYVMKKKVSIHEDSMIPVEPHINSKWMERVRTERAGRREAPPPEQQNEEAAEIPQAPQFQQGFPPNFMADFNNAMAAMQLQTSQRLDAFQERFDAAQEENRKSFSDINERMDRMDHQLNFLCNTNQMMNENLLFPYQATEFTMREMEQRGIPVTMENMRIQKHREEVMCVEGQRYQKILDEALAQRAKELNKGKARRTQDDSDED